MNSEGKNVFFLLTEREYFLQRLKLTPTLPWYPKAWGEQERRISVSLRGIHEMWSETVWKATFWNAEVIPLFLFTVSQVPRQSLHILHQGRRERKCLSVDVEDVTRQTTVAKRPAGGKESTQSASVCGPRLCSGVRMKEEQTMEVASAWEALFPFPRSHSYRKSSWLETRTNLAEDVCGLDF